MDFGIDMASLEKLNAMIAEHADPKYKGIVDPKGIDNLKREVAKNPELRKFFKFECSDKER